MKTLRLLLAGVAFAASTQLCALAATSSLTVDLQALNGSGETGTATLTQMGSDVQVVVELKGAPATAQPAHIHDGTCANLKGVAYALTSIVDGKSTSTVNDITIDKLLAGTFAINVHESASDLGKYVACGNVVKSSM